MHRGTSNLLCRFPFSAQCDLEAYAPQTHPPLQKLPHHHRQQLMHAKCDVPRIIPKELPDRQAPIACIIGINIRRIIMLTIPCCVLDPVRSWVIQNAIKERVGIEKSSLWSPDASGPKRGRGGCHGVVGLDHGCVREVGCTGEDVPELCTCELL
jgi:hypothetical protein